VWAGPLTEPWGHVGSGWNRPPFRAMCPASIELRTSGRCPPSVLVFAAVTGAIAFWARPPLDLPEPRERPFWAISHGFPSAGFEAEFPGHVSFFPRQSVVGCISASPPPPPPWPMPFVPGTPTTCHTESVQKSPHFFPPVPIERLCPFSAFIFLMVPWSRTAAPLGFLRWLSWSTTAD